MPVSTGRQGGDRSRGGWGLLHPARWKEGMYRARQRWTEAEENSRSEDSKQEPTSTQGGTKETGGYGGREGSREEEGTQGRPIARHVQRAHARLQGQKPHLTQQHDGHADLF